jgi:hypothetical protein
MQVIKLLVNGKLSKQGLLVKGKATAQVVAAVQVNGKLSESRLTLLNGKLSKSELLLVNGKTACQWQVKGMATCQWQLVQAVSQWQDDSDEGGVTGFFVYGNEDFALPMTSRRDYPMTSPSRALGPLIVTSLIGSTGTYQLARGLRRIKKQGGGSGRE